MEAWERSPQKYKTSSARSTWSRHSEEDPAAGISGQQHAAKKHSPCIAAKGMHTRDAKQVQYGGWPIPDQHAEYNTYIVLYIYTHGIGQP
eukprot:scaffold26824_cov24-Tisochrysis_lutea.AAC.1